MDNTEEFRCLSLVTGYAGIELGLRRVIRNLRTVAYVEVEAFACANLAAKIEAGLLDAAPIWTDAETFPARYFRNRVHIITAGYPCQGESAAGKRLGKADPRWLWPHIERIIKAVRPIWFFGENVSNHLNIGYPTVYGSLRDMGYKVEAGIFSAAECGAPHRRERLFILAHNPNSRCETSQVQQKRQSTLRNHSSKLAHCECAGAGQGVIKKTSPEVRRDRSAISSFDMADTATQRPQGSGLCQARWAEPTGTNKWPARSGQPQYEWEEPRCIMANTTGAGTWNKKEEVERQKRPQNVRQENRQARSIRINTTSQGQAQSRLGRAVDGACSRLDRLRLLGNGVVPQQAEKAFRNLIRLFE